MRTPAIQKIVSDNPDAIFHLRLPREADYSDRRTASQEWVGKLHFHPEDGGLMATIVGANYPRPQSPDAKPPRPIRIDSRYVVKPYEEK